MDDNRRGSKHVSFMEHRSGLVRSQTTSSFEESSAHMGPAARWRMAAARSQERLLDGPMIKPKKQPCYIAHQEDGPKPNKTVIMGKKTSLFLVFFLFKRTISNKKIYLLPKLLRMEIFIDALAWEL